MPNSPGMPNPPGMRVQSLPINATDAVHIYSGPATIWLQLRRNYPTKDDIGVSSFKSALNLTPHQAIDLAKELLAVASKQLPHTTVSKPAKLNEVKRAETTVKKQVAEPVIKSPWSPKEDKQLQSRLISKMSIEAIAKRHKRQVADVTSRIQKLKIELIV